MNGVDSLQVRFVGMVPEPLEAGIFYVSIEHATMMHLCACGCGSEVALPLAPTDWRFTYDGATISVSPSVGSWSLPCRSHYVIDRGRVRWAEDWSDREIEAGRNWDRQRKEVLNGAPAVQLPPDDDTSIPAQIAVTERGRSSLPGLRRWIAKLAGRAST